MPKIVLDSRNAFYQRNPGGFSANTTSITFQTLPLFDCIQQREVPTHAAETWWDDRGVDRGVTQATPLKQRQLLTSYCAITMRSLL